MMEVLQATVANHINSNRTALSRNNRIVSRIASQKHELRFCTYKTCKNQGARQICQFVKDLGLCEVTVQETGCLGNCGNGPNILLKELGEDSSVQRLSHISTPSHMAKVLSKFCHVTVEDSILKATECRLAGNLAARRGDLQGAVRHFDKGLEAAPSWGRHLLLSNRSGVKLALGDAEGALLDAVAAEHCAPPTFATASVRQVEALQKMGKLCEAQEVLVAAGERWPDFGSSPEYQALRQTVEECAAV